MPPKKAVAKRAAPKKAEPKPEPCVWHPPNRVVGGVCMQCGFAVPAKK